MARFTFADIREQLSDGDTRISTVGALWRQAHLTEKSSAEHTVIAVPMTLHLTGRVHSVVYAEMPVVTGEKLRDAHRPAPMAWIAGKLRERRRAGLLRFSMPDIGLSWRQPSQDTDAVTIATYLARVLAEEFPQPEEELARHFHMDIDKLVAHLAETEPTRAGAMQTDDKA